MGRHFLATWGNALSAKHLAILLFILVCIQACQCPCLAARQSSQAAPASRSGKSADAASLIGPFEKIDDVIDPLTAQLLWQISHKPELMNVDYLSYYLGPPDRNAKQMGVGSTACYWYDELHRLRCELYQEEAAPGQVVESRMIFHLLPGDLDFDLMRKAFGPPVRRYFDQNAFATEMYCWVPNTALSMSTPPNTFSITKAGITYIGAPLGQPDVLDVQRAHDSFIASTQSPSIVRGQPDWSGTLVLARRRLLESPYDPAAHAALAEALKRTTNLHEAICEYKTALSLNTCSDAVRQQCIQGLKDLYVLPRDYMEGNPAPGQSTRLAGRRSVPSN